MICPPKNWLQHTPKTCGSFVLALDEWSTIEVTPELIELAQSVVSGPIPGFTVTLAQNAVPTTETVTYTF